MYSISVAMAVYNGEEFLREQIDSILIQLRDMDELVISYNNSIDNTLGLIQNYAKLDTRIKIYYCNKKGVLSNFENAISKCTNDLIFLSDQDDIWKRNKISEIVPLFQDKNVLGVCHNKIYVDKNLKFLDKEINKKDKEKLKKNTIKLKFIKILIKNNVQGSCLAFRRDCVKYILPFPLDIPMHDSWIGSILTIKGDLIYINKQLLLYRMHEHNVSPKIHGSISQMYKNRIILLKNYIRRRKEIQ